MADLTCPFCNEADFDAIGLKQHLQRGWCDAFNETPNTDRPEPVKPLPPAGVEAPRTDHIRSVPGGAAFLRVAAAVEACSRCHGDGYVLADHPRAEPEPCPKCNAGVGEVPRG